MMSVTHILWNGAVVLHAPSTAYCITGTKMIDFYVNNVSFMREIIQVAWIYSKRQKLYELNAELYYDNISCSLVLYFMLIHISYNITYSDKSVSTFVFVHANISYFLRFRVYLWSYYHRGFTFEQKYIWCCLITHEVN